MMNRDFLSQFVGRPVLITETALMKHVYDLSRGAKKKTSEDSDSVDICDIDNYLVEAPKMEVTTDGLAIVPICGVIGRGFSAVEKAYCGVCDIDQLEEDVKTCMFDANIKGVLFVANTPGGNAVKVPEVAKLICELSNYKPTVAFTDELCASAGEWLTSQCNYVTATESAEIGSIGVYTMFFDVSEFYKSMGIKVELFKAGALKAAGAPGTTLSDAQRANIQAGVDGLYNMFVGAVTRKRPTVKTETCQGQCFLASECVENGLIDEVVSGIDQAASILREVAL